MNQKNRVVRFFIANLRYEGIKFETFGTRGVSSLLH